MARIETEPLLENLPLQSSLSQLGAAMRRARIFVWSHDCLQDHHFVKHILPIGLKSMDDATAFLQKLDTDSHTDAGAKGCAKAHSARQFMAYPHSLEVDPFDWTLISLAHARRTQCACHETGSFHQREQYTKNAPKA